MNFLGSLRKRRNRSQASVLSDGPHDVVVNQKTGQLRVQDKWVDPVVGMSAVLTINGVQLLVKYCKKLSCELPSSEFEVLYVRPRPDGIHFTKGSSFTIFVGTAHFLVTVENVLRPTQSAGTPTILLNDTRMPDSRSQTTCTPSTLYIPERKDPFAFAPKSQIQTPDDKKQYRLHTPIKPSPLGTNNMLATPSPTPKSLPPRPALPQSSMKMETPEEPKRNISDVPQSPVPSDANVLPEEGVQPEVAPPKSRPSSSGSGKQEVSGTHSRSTGHAHQKSRTPENPPPRSSVNNGRSHSPPGLNTVPATPTLRRSTRGITRTLLTRNSHSSNEPTSNCTSSSVQAEAPSGSDMDVDEAGLPPTESTREQDGPRNLDLFVPNDINGYPAQIYSSPETYHSSPQSHYGPEPLDKDNVRLTPAAPRMPQSGPMESVYSPGYGGNGVLEQGIHTERRIPNNPRVSPTIRYQPYEDRHSRSVVAEPGSSERRTLSAQDSIVSQNRSTNPGALGPIGTGRPRVIHPETAAGSESFASNPTRGNLGFNSPFPEMRNIAPRVPPGLGIPVPSSAFQKDLPEIPDLEEPPKRRSKGKGRATSRDFVPSHGATRSCAPLSDMRAEPRGHHPHRSPAVTVMDLPEEGPSSSCRWPEAMVMTGNSRMYYVSATFAHQQIDRAYRQPHNNI